MNEKNNKKTIVILVSAIMALVGVICEIIGAIEWTGYLYISPELVSFVVLFIMTLYYVLVGYKKPHGNLLRYTFLLLALTCLNGAIDTAMSLAYTEADVNIQLIIIGCYGFAAILIGYVAGRLDKIRSNFFPLVLITTSLAATSLLFSFLYNCWSNIVYIIWDASTFLLWIDLMVAYTIRYREHKEAGLLDK